MKMIATFFFISSFLLNSCVKHELQSSLAPAHFKTELPFIRTNDGIILKTYWGANKIEQDLLLDNHSPTWGNNAVIKNNPSVHISNNIGYKTTTGDGATIHGDVYVCDSIFLGGVAFKQVSFYKIARDEYLGKQKNFTGVVGDNIMAAGIWKIDLKNRVITIASNLDSIKDINKATKIPAKFNDAIISIETQLGGNITKTFELDLGFNLTCLIPFKDFTSIYNKKNPSAFSSISTPAGLTPIKVFQASDKIKIGNIECQTIIITHASAKENLIGLAFFDQFDFIILDYINKALYVQNGR